MKNLLCDYLIIGSGAAPLAFLDTLLTEMPNKKVVLIDKKAVPGGHWVDDYDFVQLHQPSIVYGIASMALEGNWAKCLFTKFMLPWNHRARKQELLDYFQNFVDSKSESGQVQYFPECIYDFGQKLDASGRTTFASLDGKESYTVEVRDKLINGVQGENVIPSLSPPGFPFDDGVNLVTPNQVFELQQGKLNSKAGYLSSLCGGGGSESSGSKDRHFIVLGAGKTAMDTVVFLQRTLGVSPSNISWVIPNDVWMMSRGKSSPSSYVSALLDSNNDKEKAVLALEAKGQFVRLDHDFMPTRFRFPVVGADEIALMRKIDHKIRRGRVSSIRLDTDTGDIRVAFENKDDKSDWVIPKTSDKEYIFVHCTSPGPFNGKDVDDALFLSKQEMTLDLLYAPPISISMSCLAKLEAARQQGTLDTEFGRNILGNKGASVNEILCDLIRSSRTKFDKKEPTFLDELKSTINHAIFIALVDKDPMVGYNWLKSNRLSMMSVPGSKGRFVEDLEAIVEKGPALGSDPVIIDRIKKVAEKLEPLRGK